MREIKLAVIASMLFLVQAFGLLFFLVILAGSAGPIENPGGAGGTDLVTVALEEEKGETAGGEKYWSFLGFSARVEWCASFVSWCADACGYYGEGKDILPKSALCEDFRTYHKKKGEWKDSAAHGGSYIPKAGDLILFQWDGKPAERVEHIGIVTGCEEGQVLTVEGNSSDRVRLKRYALSDQRIIGYCTPVYPDSGTMGSGGHKTDETLYTKEEIELIYACVQQEDGQTYEGALAVISTVMNRVDSPQWKSCGGNALEQLKAPGQFCYSIDENWKKWLDGNVSAQVKKAVHDCLKEGIRNHGYTSFRSKQGSHTGGMYIPANGNYYFSEGR